jgi:hypothetical protein
VFFFRPGVAKKEHTKGENPWPAYVLISSAPPAVR